MYLIVYDLVYELWYVCVIVVSECYAVCLNRRSIDFEFGSSPVSALGVVPDLVVGFISEPVGERSVSSSEAQRLTCITVEQRHKSKSEG